MSKTRLVEWAVLLAVLAVALVAAYLIYHGRKKLPALSLQGAVIRQDTDFRKQTPIDGVEITAANDLAASDCRSDPSGFFRLPLRAGVRRGQAVNLLLQHAGYEPLAVKAVAGDQIYVAHMVPVSRETVNTVGHPDVVISDVGVRYSLKTTAMVNVGSVVKTFQVANTGNVPCNNRPPCSPDGRWKAAIGAISLDAGRDSDFQNIRVSCIAGPCPFTTMSRNFSADSRTIKVSALDWSDTATFQVEAEVVRPMVSAVVRHLYPVSFGEALNFTVPAWAEGVYVEAALDGKPIIFPLGPDLDLDWADCNASVNRDEARVYRCELKPGYRFQ